MVRSRVVWATLVVAAVVVAVAAALMVGSTDPTAAPRSSPSVLEAASLPQAARPVEPPEARFTRTVYAATTMPDSDPLIDLCRGPIAIDLGDEHPLLVAEHDYCGGSAWMPKLEVGDGVELGGPGVDEGRYVVTDIAFGQRRQARMSDLPDAAVVLQTCVSDTRIVMVGLEPSDTVFAS